MAKIRTHSEPLPRSDDQIVSLFKHVIQLSEVMEIRVTPEEFAVTRMMENDDDPVVSKKESSADADLEYVLAQTVENLYSPDFDPNQHPYFALVDATSRLSNERLRICGIMAPEGPLFSDYFGLPEGEMPQTFMGIRVIYHRFEDKYPDKIVVFGGPTSYFNDATHGIILDTGV